MNRITPTTELPVGTEVFSGNKKGTVVKAQWEKDQFGFPIVVHTVNFTGRATHRSGSADGKRTVYKPMNETTRINYSALTVKTPAQ